MIRPITIGHTLHAFKEGGTERGVLNIVLYGNSNRFRHVIVCFSESGEFAERISSTTCEIIELHKRKGNDLLLPIRLARVARAHNIDILHARGWATMVETALASRLAGVPASIYGFHGRIYQDLRGISKKRQWAEKIVVRLYDRIVTLNRTMRHEFIAECKLAEESVKIIANGVDAAAFCLSPNRKALRRRFGLPEDSFIIGNVARLDRIKNHEVLLRALRRIRGLGCEGCLLIVGDGPHRSALEREVQSLGLAPHVYCIGQQDAIADLMNCMDVYVQSSFYEGFSNTLLEAMACSLPVLATDVGGTQDLIAQPEHGLLFDPNDDVTLTRLIMRLKRDSALRRQMGERGRSVVIEKFSVQRMVRDYEAMYLELYETMTQKNGKLSAPHRVT